MTTKNAGCLIVSGGSRGLGAAVVADALARQQPVACFSRSRTPFLEDCESRFPGKFLWTSLDATDDVSLRQFVVRVTDEIGPIVGVVNNAGTLTEGVLTLTRPAQIHALLAANLASAILLTQACVRAMLAHGLGGSIVNVSSVNGLRGNAGVSVYSATKAGMDGFSRSIARELGSKGIRVNSVAPGYFKSDMTAAMSDRQQEQIVRRTPLGRLGEVSDIVAVIRFLLSRDAAFVTGQTIAVDGGLTC